MWGTISRGILKFADKQIKKKVYKVGNKKTSWKNKWDPKSGKKVLVAKYKNGLYYYLGDFDVNNQIYSTQFHEDLMVDYLI